MYKKRPSELIKINSEYEAFCFDEICAYIKLKIENGEEPKYSEKVSSFADFYKKLGVGECVNGV